MKRKTALIPILLIAQSFFLGACGNGNKEISSEIDETLITEDNISEDQEKNSKDNTESVDNKNTDENNEAGEEMNNYKITFQEDENVPFWDVYDSFNRGEFEFVEALPGDLSRDNFAAYLSYSGNDTDNEECVATYEDGFLMVYRLVNSGGDQTKYAGIVENDDSFIEKLNSLEYKKVDWAESQGEAEDYGAVYFKKDGKMYYCFTENIFSDN